MLIDTHAHLDQEAFDTDRDEVIARAKDAGVEAIVAVGITANSSRMTCQLAARHPLVRAAVGIHPNECGAAKADDWSQVIRLLEDPGVVALGETGLDRHWDTSPWEFQQEYFDRHIRLARERHLPLVIHQRDCADEMMAVLRAARARGPLAGVMHSFTGTADMAAECVEIGLHISFAGMVTFKKSDELRSVAATIPDDRILVETDAPYLAPHPKRGKRNEPANVVYTASCLAHVRGVPPEEFAAQTTRNARALFGW